MPSSGEVSRGIRVAALYGVCRLIEDEADEMADGPYRDELLKIARGLGRWAGYAPRTKRRAHGRTIPMKLGGSDAE